MKETLKKMNLMDTENFKIKMDSFIKENGNNNYFMGKAMKLINNLNIREDINLDIVKDMERLHIKMVANIQGNFRKINMRDLVSFCMRMEEKY